MEITSEQYEHIGGLLPRELGNASLDNLALLNAVPYVMERAAQVTRPAGALRQLAHHPHPLEPMGGQGRTQSMLPMGLGYVEGVTHDHVLHGATTLFAALDVAAGEVPAQCKRRHRHQEFLAFLRHIDASVLAHLEIHLIVDNYATHKHPKVRNWLARRARCHMHCTPTHASWINQVERWFGLITQQAVRLGSFSNVKELVGKINASLERYNARPSSFAWVATAESILAKIERLRSVVCGTGH